MNFEFDQDHGPRPGPKLDDIIIKLEFQTMSGQLQKTTRYQETLSHPQVTGQAWDLDPWKMLIK